MGGPALAIRMVLRRTGRHPRLAAAFAYSTPSHDRTVEAGWRPSLLELRTSFRTWRLLTFMTPIAWFSTIPSMRERI